MTIQEMIDTLKKCGSLINNLIDDLEINDSKPEEKTGKPLDMVDVRKVLVEIARDGSAEKIKSLLTKYGASKLSEVDPKYYEDLLKDAKGISN